MVREFQGRKVAFVKFQNADSIVVDEAGRELVISKAIWAALPEWTKSPAHS